jgi:hypothetical protein
MSGENKTEKLFLYLDMGEILDQDQLDDLTRQLQSELLDQEVENADLLRGDELPQGAKSAEVITWGAIVLEVLPKFLPSVLEYLKSWVQREESRNIKISTQVGDNSIELEYSSKGIKDEEVTKLVSILTASLKDTTKAHEAAVDHQPATDQDDIESPVEEEGVEESQACEAEGPPEEQTPTGEEEIDKGDAQSSQAEPDDEETEV